MLEIIKLYLKLKARAGTRDEGRRIDLTTRETLLLCTKEQPILQLALHDNSIWVATTDSSVSRWPAEGKNPQNVFQRGGSFLAANLSFSRARVSLEARVYPRPCL
ncbi:hypothetical protein V6N12_034869 [Hibiscus sabdariffa]|uniref:Uncharacterized protein n=1 Tax=Hibiscus sabdariffa TaxID=183260 RepID=A0ABR2BPH5_9ROSI